MVFDKHPIAAFIVAFSVSATLSFATLTYFDWPTPPSAGAETLPLPIVVDGRQTPV